MSSPPVTPPTIHEPSRLIRATTRLTTTTTMTSTNSSMLLEALTQQSNDSHSSKNNDTRLSHHLSESAALSREQRILLQEQADFSAVQQPQLQACQSQPRQEPSHQQEQSRSQLLQSAFDQLDQVLMEKRDAELVTAALRYEAEKKAIEESYQTNLRTRKEQLQTPNTPFVPPSFIPDGSGHTAGRRAVNAYSSPSQGSTPSAISATTVNSRTLQVGPSSLRAVDRKPDHGNLDLSVNGPVSMPPLRSPSPRQVPGTIALSSSPPPPTPSSILNVPREDEAKPKSVDDITEGSYGYPSSVSMIGRRYVWDLTQRLGRGNSAKVFKCVDTQNESRKLAIRIVMRREGTEETFRKQNKMQKEVALMLRLKHPNIIQLYEFFYCEKKWYMILERCDSVLVRIKRECRDCKVLDRPILHNDCRSKIFTEEICRDIFKQMVLGIEYLHAHGAIHRDIKPGNLLLIGHVLKICDFGISQVFPNGEKMTIEGGQGTGAFMAPEFFEGNNVKTAEPTDIWSMGVTLYVMAYGELPFPISDREPCYPYYNKFRKQEGDGPNSPLWTLIKRLLERNPDHRISMERLREDPWLTEDGKFPLPSKQDNTGDKIVLTELEINSAVRALVTKAVSKFKEGARRRAQNSTIDSGLSSTLETLPTPEALEGPSMRWNDLDTDPRWDDNYYQSGRFVQSEEGNGQSDLIVQSEEDSTQSDRNALNEEDSEQVDWFLTAHEDL
ncbi:hypothetical protein EMPS_10726 [Entomortierella parvispora]|uniref:Protein kinase domain-containing protein n=1 Tax=Entomortierella parvispora TaxID=205924 RepID=A0A9P3M1L6_9FUNG|nr:hypothetical protein EMPS_10726 [Entomortierella parvispora]